MKCCDLTAGSLRNRVTIQRPVYTTRPDGGRDTAWSDHIVDMPCKVLPRSGVERLTAGRLEADISHRIFARFGHDILTSDRVSMAGRLMQIVAVINIEERGRWLEISANEGEST